uniref:DNA-directed RNA polymerase n=1 Tax=Chloromonas radiata TaxID=47907 RepID=A0A0S2ICY3_9CHLO|nr:beta subunit of RNA polymerase [Chloromonas radiata]
MHSHYNLISFLERKILTRNGNVTPKLRRRRLRDFFPFSFLVEDRQALISGHIVTKGSKQRSCFKMNSPTGRINDREEVSNFFKATNSYLISDFVDIQRKSFFELLEKGLIEEFSKRNPITNKNLEIFFYPEYYQLTPPEYNPRRAILLSKSYSSKLFIPAQLTDKKMKKSQLKWVLIGNLPLMTKRGHFVLNGAPRVIVNQILRSPGIYFQGSLKEIFSEKWSEKPEITYKRFYTDLICLRGTWLRIEIDKNKDIWAQMKKVPKIPLLWFLLAMGLTERIIFKSVINPTRLLANFNLNIKRKISHSSPTGRMSNRTDYEYVTNASDAWKEISYLISSKSLHINVQKNAFLEFEKPLSPTGNKKGNTSPPGRKWPKGTLSSVKVKKTETNKQVGKRGLITFFLNFDKLLKTSNKKLLLCTYGRSNFFLLALKNRRPPLYYQSPTGIDNSPLKNGKNVRGSVAFLEVPSSLTEHSKEGRNWIFKRFMNPRTYDLGKQGRLNFNRKLGLAISYNQTTLTAQDVLFATDYLLKVEKGLKNIDDIDHLKNRRVRTSGELLQIQIGIGLVRLEKIIREKLSKINALLIRTPLASASLPLPSKQLRCLRKISSPYYLQSSLNPTPPGELRTPKARALGKGVKQGTGMLLPSSRGVGQKDFKTFITPLFFLFKRNSTLPPPVVLHYDKLLEEFKLNNLINTKAFNGALREFFGTSQLSQFMDQLNPLAEITHKRRLSSMGPGGVTRDSATLAIRGIHPTHYGRICPIETPEGKNTGLVNSLTTYARANLQGFLESPFYKVYKGQIQINAGIFFLSAEQEEKIKLAAADVSFPYPCPPKQSGYKGERGQGRIGFLPKSKIPAKVAYGDTISKISRNIVEYIGVSPIQMISIATSLIPFLEHDDANRALMGSNMQRQAVPLIRAERPLVGTGLESRAVSDSGHAVIAKESGYVAYVSAKKIIIYTLPNQN